MTCKCGHGHLSKQQQCFAWDDKINDYCQCGRKSIDEESSYDLRVHCRNQQHYLFERKSPLICRFLGHKIHWEYVIVHEDIKPQTPDSIEVFSYNKDGQSITQDLLSMCTRCKLLFRREDGDNGLFGIVKIRPMEADKITERSSD